MILNEITGNLYKIENTCRNIAQNGKQKCVVFSVYDMCKDILSRYKGLTLKAAKSGSKNKVQGRGEGEIDLGEPYWHLEGADTESTVDAVSILGEAMLEKMQQYASEHD